MKNYIKFYFDYYDNHGNFTAEIHKEGKYKKVKSEKDILKLLEIAQDYGYNIQSEGVLTKHAQNITKEFDKYTKKEHQRKNKKNRLNIFGNITKNMKVSRKNKTLGKAIIVGTILTAIAVNGMSTKKNTSIAMYEETKDKTSSSISVDETDIKTTQDIDLDDYIDEVTNTEEKQEEVQEQVQEENVVKQEIAVQGVKKEVKEEKKAQLDSMLQADSFHYSYEDRSTSQNVRQAKRYDDIFEKYANQYGVDKDLLIAMASQESSGEHYNNLRDTKPAAGIMQIEKSVHVGNSVSAYNFNTGKVETVQVTQDKLNDVDTNIKIGTMILRGYIENANYNIPLAIQTYNMGPGNMSKVLNSCSSIENIEVSTMKNNPTNNKWLNYRSHINAGDSKYVEHVFSYLGDKQELSVKKRDNTKVSVNITNDNINSIQK